MRDFLNAPTGLPQQSLAVNEKPEMDSPQSPLGGRTVRSNYSLIQQYCSVYRIADRSL